MKIFFLVVLISGLTFGLKAQSSKDSAAAATAKGIKSNLNQYLEDNVGKNTNANEQKLLWANDSLKKVIYSLQSNTNAATSIALPSKVYSCYFELGSATLDQNEISELNYFINNLSATRIVLMAYADASGGNSINQELCEKRLAAVKSQIDKANFSGEIKTFANGKIDKAKAQKAAGSRRVDVLVYLN